MKVRVILEFELSVTEQEIEMDAEDTDFEDAAKGAVEVVEEIVAKGGGFLPITLMNRGVSMAAWSVESEIVLGSVQGD